MGFKSPRFAKSNARAVSFMLPTSVPEMVKFLKAKKEGSVPMVVVPFGAVW